MVNVLVITNDNQIIDHASLNRIAQPDVKWSWIDFEAPDEEEAKLLHDFFHFHPLSIEDCFQYLQRPKLDHYDDYDFLVLQSINPASLEAEEIDLFLAPKFAVSFHLAPSPQIGVIRQRLCQQSALAKGPRYLAYIVMDVIVDEYFPLIYGLEDRLSQIETITGTEFINALYQIRDHLLSLRRTVVPMRELIYKIMNTDHLPVPKEEKMHFKDIDDHLVKISEMIESNREITADMRDSYISLNSFRLNTIMKTLTIIASIFIPLTFIVGVYGMNFDYMPELRMHSGYFITLIVMGLIAVGMMIGFWIKGWFE